MKKYTFIILCFIVLQITVAQKAHATAAIGATFPQQIIDDITQVASKAASFANEANTALLKYDQTIGRPLATAMINIAQQDAAKNIVNWANGGFSGSAPLIVSNPEKYLEQQGRAELKRTMDSIPKNSVLGDSIFGAMLGQYQNKSLKTQLLEATRTDAPTIIQNDFCDDDNLTDIATEDVQDEDGNVDPLELANRRSELYDQLCAEDPEDNPVVAERLMAVQQQRPSLGGFNLLLDTTVGGHSEFAANNRTVTLASNAAAKAEETAKNKVFLGEKPLSQTECIQEEPNVDTVYLRDENGNVVLDSRNEPVPDPSVATTKTCAKGKEVTITPGSTVASAIEKAANSGIDRLTNLTGEGLTGIIATLAIQRLTSGINSVAQSALKEARESLSTGSSNTVSTITTTNKFLPDLKGDTETKNSTLAPMLKQLTYYGKQLKTLRPVDQEYISLVNSYESKISEGKSCYDSLVNEGIIPSDDPQVTHAYGFYADRQSQVDDLKNTLTLELQNIDSAEDLISKTTATITASNSSQEIMTTFTGYTNTIDIKNYPTSQAVAERPGELNKSKLDMSDDFKDIPSGSTVRENAKTVQDSCNQLRNSRNYNSGNYGG